MLAQFIPIKVFNTLTGGLRARIRKPRRGWLLVAHQRSQVLWLISPHHPLPRALIYLPVEIVV